jgi:hypothetical protein
LEYDGPAGGRTRGVNSSIVHYALITLGVLNGATTGLVWLTGDCFPEQRRARTVFVWLVPLVGCLVVLAMRWNAWSEGRSQADRGGLHESSVDVSARDIHGGSQPGDSD